MNWLRHQCQEAIKVTNDLKCECPVPVLATNGNSVVSQRSEIVESGIVTTLGCHLEVVVDNFRRQICRIEHNGTSGIDGVTLVTIGQRRALTKFLKQSSQVNQLGTNCARQTAALFT